jgi:hypothetical protein
MRRELVIVGAAVMAFVVVAIYIDRRYQTAIAYATGLPIEGVRIFHANPPPLRTDHVPPDMRPFFAAIAQVESGANDLARGDGSKSLGRYQISRDYWNDAGVPGPYGAVTRADYAERVMLAYWQRWCPMALKSRDYQTLARVHNGGPRGAQRDATLNYWRRVKGAMK